MYIFREARAAITTTRVDELITNARVGANAYTNAFDVRTQLFSQVSYFVHEADFSCQHGVGCVLGQLSRTNIHENQLVVVTTVGGVALAHTGFYVVRIRTNDDSRALGKVFNGCTLFQKLRVGTDIDRQRQVTRSQLIQNFSLDLIRGPHRYRGLINNDFVFVHMLTNGFGHRENVFQICRTVFVRRSADSNNLNFGEFNGFARIGREVEATRCVILNNHRLQTRLIDGDNALLQVIDFYFINIDACHMVPNICQAGTGDQTYIPRAENSNFQSITCIFKY